MFETRKFKLLIALFLFLAIIAFPAGICTPDPKGDTTPTQQQTTNTDTSTSQSLFISATIANLNQVREKSYNAVRQLKTLNTYGCFPTVTSISNDYYYNGKDFYLANVVNDSNALIANLKKEAQINSDGIISINITEQDKSLDNTESVDNYNFTTWATQVYNYFSHGCPNLTPTAITLNHGGGYQAIQGPSDDIPEPIIKKFIEEHGVDTTREILKDFVVEPAIKQVEEKQKVEDQLDQAAWVSWDNVPNHA